MEKLQPRLHLTPEEAQKAYKRIHATPEELVEIEKEEARQRMIRFDVAENIRLENNRKRGRAEKWKVELRAYESELIYPTRNERLRWELDSETGVNLNVFSAYLRLRGYISTGKWPENRSIPVESLREEFWRWKEISGIEAKKKQRSAALWKRKVDEYRRKMIEREGLKRGKNLGK